jgi:hypothetical protein
MGAGASAEVSARVAYSSVEELEASLAGLSQAQRQGIAAALTADDVSACIGQYKAPVDHPCDGYSRRSEPLAIPPYPLSEGCTGEVPLMTPTFSDGYLVSK